MNSMIDEYKKCAQICKNTDYGNKSSVKAHNLAILKMYQIVQAVDKKGSNEVEKLATLLDDDIAKHWLAYQLIEKINVNSNIEKKCLSIIRKIADDKNSIESFGARKWLEKWGKDKT